MKEPTSRTSFVSSLLLAGLLWTGLLRTDGTPAGDGERVSKFISFMRGPGDGFALWDPYRNGGYPVLASPEHFWLQTLLVDPSSPSANLLQNMTLYFYLLAFAPLAWLLARRCGLSPLWAAVAAVLVSFSEFNINLAVNGQFTGIINVASLLVVLAVATKDRLDPWDYATLAVSIAAGLSTGMQYALLHILALSSSLLFGEASGWDQPVRKVVTALVRTAAVSAVSVLLAAVWLVPFFGHLQSAKTGLAGITYEPNLPDGIVELSRLLMPYAGTDKMLLPLFLVPAAILSVWGRPQAVERLLLRYCLLIALALVFVVMAWPGIGPVLSEGYRRLPVLSSIRQFSVASAILLFLGTISALLVIQHHEHRSLGDLPNKSKLLISSYAVATGLSTIYFGLKTGHSHFEIAGGILLAAGIFLLLSGLGYFAPSDRIERTPLRDAVLGLAAAHVTLILPQAYAQNDLLTKKPLFTANGPELASLHAQIAADKTGYYRVLKDTRNFTFIETMRRGGTVVSLYFPQGFAYSLAYLSSKYDLSAQRPHWVPAVRCSEYDKRALELLSVRYLVCWGKSLKGAVPENFVEAGRDSGMVLFKRITNNGALRVFCKNRPSETVAPMTAREEALKAFASGVAIVQPGTNWPSDPGCPEQGFADSEVKTKVDKPDHMILEVSSKHAGLLVIPDNYDSGWSATVNGNPAIIARAFHAYRGIPVERGTNVVDMRFRDRYFELGARISLATAILLALVLLGSWLRSRKV